MIGYAFCGSFCTFNRVIPILEKLVALAKAFVNWIKEFFAFTGRLTEKNA